MSLRANLKTSVMQYLETILILQSQDGMLIESTTDEKLGKILRMRVTCY